MNLFIRGVIWFGLYVLLIVLPATVAIAVDPFATARPALVEVSVALGFLAFPLVMIQFALVSHLRASSRPFGTDAVVLFHQYVGFLGLLLVLAHPLLLNVQGLSWAAWSPVSGTFASRSGAIGTFAIVLLVVTTVSRRRLALSYEWWQRLHLWLAVVAAAAILAHVLRVRGYAPSAGLRYLLFCYVVVFGLTVAYYRVGRPLRMRRQPWTITENRHESGSTRTLRVRPVGHDGFDFEPGQFAWLVTGRTPWSSQQHPLSMSSSAERAHDRALEFSVKALGTWSATVVPALTPGTRVWIDGPFGAFTIDRKIGQGFVLIAGGIGIAPFRSMLQTMRDRGDRRHVVLFYAAHDETRTVFQSELEKLREAMALDVVYVFEAPSPGWTGERGRITTDILQRHLPARFRRYAYFVCGPPPMMDAVETMLVSLGVPSGSIETERFNVV
jgi:predicted ferric reductase